MKTAVIVTLCSVIWWAALLVVSRILLLQFQFDPWAFSFVQLCAGGVALLLAGGVKHFDFTSFLRPTTWVLGVLRVLSAASYTAVLVWISVLEAGILGAINIPMVAIAVWLIFGRRPARGEWVGHIVIFIPIVLLVFRLEGGILLTVVGLMLFNETCLIAATILAERHPDNLSDQAGARLRFTGAVLLVTAIFFLIIQGMLGETGNREIDWVLLLSGIAVGVTLRAPSMLLSFWSIWLIGARNYMAAISLLPLLGMGFEQIAFATGYIVESRFHILTVGFAITIVVGTVFVLFARLRATQLAVKKQASNHF